MRTLSTLDSATGFSPRLESRVGWSRPEIERDFQSKGV